MKVPEKNTVTINGYGAVSAETLEDLSVVLNRLKGYVIVAIAREGREVTFGRFAEKKIVAHLSSATGLWHTGL